jgi:hypothetical protein
VILNCWPAECTHQMGERGACYARNILSLPLPLLRLFPSSLSPLPFRYRQARSYRNHPTRTGPQHSGPRPAPPPALGSPPRASCMAPGAAHFKPSANEQTSSVSLRPGARPPAKRSWPPTTMREVTALCLLLFQGNLPTSPVSCFFGFLRFLVSGAVGPPPPALGPVGKHSAAHPCSLPVTLLHRLISLRGVGWVCARGAGARLICDSACGLRSELRAVQFHRRTNLCRSHTGWNTDLSPHQLLSGHHSSQPLSTYPSLHLSDCS